MDSQRSGHNGYIGLNLVKTPPPHLSINMSPCQALYGRVPPHFMRVGQQSTPVDSLDQLLQERNIMLEDLKFNMMKAQLRMKQQAD